ncbi:MAG: hypothetical protein E7774_11425 [Bradyrhizobium sp.]|nr:MAG: hypothetical protein E7774_11425 [Bradyrhizobium sp.]
MRKLEHADANLDGQTGTQLTHALDAGGISFDKIVEPFDAAGVVCGAVQGSASKLLGALWAAQLCHPPRVPPFPKSSKNSDTGSTPETSK